MAYVNIPRNRDDPNYRYKMPKIMSRIEGRGNGIKTNIANMGDISRALKRPPMYPTKFFCCELGTMAKFEESEEKVLINGAHTERDLAIILDKFIEMYVLCPNCQLPEIDVIVKRGILLYSCNACGSQGNLDMTHKAASYMIKNPTDSMKKTKKSEKHSKEKEKAEEEEPVKNSKEKDKEKKKEKKKKKSKGDTSDESSDSYSGKSYSNVDSVTKKGKEISLELLSFNSPEIQDVIKRLGLIVENNEVSDNELFVQELHMLQLSQDFDSKCRMFVGFSVLLANDLSLSNFEKNIPSFVKLANNSVTAEDVLDALDYYYYIKDSDLTRTFPYIVQQLYNSDIVKSSDIIKHYNKAVEHDVKAYKGLSEEFVGELVKAFEKCKKAVTPFLAWLEEGSDSESEDDVGSSRNQKTKSLAS